MKKVIIIVLLAVLPSVSFAQNAFSKLQNKEGIASFTINKEMFGLIYGKEVEAVGSKTTEYLNKANKLSNLNVFISSEKADSKTLRKTMQEYLKDNPMEQLITLTENGAKISIYAVPGNNPSEVKEMLFFAQKANSNQAVLVSFTGNLDLKGTN